MCCRRTIGCRESVCAGVGNYPFQIGTINGNTASIFGSSSGAKCFCDCFLFIPVFSYCSCALKFIIFYHNLNIAFRHNHLNTVEMDLIIERTVIETVFRDVLPCVLVSIYQPAATSYRVDPKVKAACFSETCVNLYHSTWHYVPEDSFLCRYTASCVSTGHQELL